jgi:Caspase domain/Sel1 repeat
MIRAHLATNVSRKLAVAALAAVLLAGASALSGVPMSPDRLMVVDCLLPSRVIKVGSSITYLSARHAIKTVVSECEIRGGEYVAYDRANFSTSLQVWLPQAKDGDPQAQIYVGEIYEKGLGTSPDYAQAAFWYQKAADQGYPRGLSDLAYLYEQGLGVPKDPVKALNLYRRSAGMSGDDLTFTSEVTAAKQQAASQIDALSGQLDASNQQAEALRQELQKAQDEAREKSTVLRSAQTETRALRERLEALKAEGSAAPADRAEIKRLQDALRASEAKVADAQQETQTLRAANDSKTAELSERIRKAADEDQALRAQLGGHVADAQQTHADLAGAQARIDSMSRQIEQLKQQVDSERATMAQEQTALGQRSTAHDAALNDELRRLRQTLADREARLVQQQALLAAVQTERGSAETEVARLKTHESELQKAQSQQHLDSDMLHAQIASLQERLLQSQQQLLAATAAADAERAGMEAEREQLAKARETASTSRQIEVKGLTVRLADREAKLIDQQTQIAALEAQGRAYQDEIATLKNVGTRGITSVGVASMPGHTAPIAAKDLNLGAFHALIIGNDDYQFMPKLQSAVSDARAVERVLREHYGFKTRLLLNAGRADILSALNDYRLSLGERDSFLIYYAGHGELNERSLLGYWLPVNAKRDDTTEWISDRMITDQIGLMPARHIMVIADSCYSGAMTRSTGLRLVGTAGQSMEVKRLSKLALLPSRTVLTSGGAEPVLDGGAGANSIFAHALIDVLSNNQGVLEGSALYDQVFDPVRKGAARFKVDQSPRYSALADAGHLNGEFLLIPAG